MVSLINNIGTCPTCRDYNQALNISDIHAMVISLLNEPYIYHHLAKYTEMMGYS